MTDWTVPSKASLSAPHREALHLTAAATLFPPFDPPTLRPPPAHGTRQPMITWKAADIFITQHSVCVVFVCVYLRTIKVNL